MLKTPGTVHTKTYNETREFYHSLHKGRGNVAMRKQKTGASLQKEVKTIALKVGGRNSGNRDSSRLATINTGNDR